MYRLRPVRSALFCVLVAVIGTLVELNRAVNTPPQLIEHRARAPPDGRTVDSLAVRGYVTWRCPTQSGVLWSASFCKQRIGRRTDRRGRRRQLRLLCRCAGPTAAPASVEQTKEKDNGARNGVVRTPNAFRARNLSHFLTPCQPAETLATRMKFYPSSYSLRCGATHTLPQYMKFAQGITVVQERRNLGNPELGAGGIALPFTHSLWLVRASDLSFHLTHIPGGVRT